MSKNVFRIAMLILVVLIVVPVVVLLVSQSRGSQPSATSTSDANMVLTAAAQTADTRLTELALVTPSATPAPPTPTFDPAQTAAAQTAEAQLTVVAAVSPTPSFSATATIAPTVSTADKAEYVSDVSVPDGSDFAPGASFTKTWRLRNAGTSTWTTAYALVFISGDKMGDNTTAPLTAQVAPGQTVDISVNLVAPSTTGGHTGYWKMRNAAGQYFETSVYVQIDVIGGSGTPAPTATSSGSGNLITGLTFVVDEASYTGTCPHTLTFSANFTLRDAATLSYQLEAGSDTPGFEFTLPAPQTVPFGAGNFTLSFPMAMSSSGSGWMQFHVTAPVDVRSSQVFFTVACQK